MTADELYDLLLLRYQAPEWVVLPEVANGTGFSREQRRYADAIGISTFPSRGLSICGFEIKVSRADWLNERKNPQKAEAISKYCNEWWLVVPEKEMAPVDEIPQRWGLLVKSGKYLKAIKKPEFNKEPTPIDMPLLAALCRRLQDEKAGMLNAMVPRKDLEPEITRRVESELQWRANQNERLMEANAQLKEDVAALYKAFGFRDGDSYYGRQHEIQKVAPLIKLLTGGFSNKQFGYKVGELGKALSNLRENLENSVTDVIGSIKKMEEEFILPKE